MHSIHRPCLLLKVLSATIQALYACPAFNLSVTKRVLSQFIVTFEFKTLIFAHPPVRSLMLKLGSEQMLRYRATCRYKIPNEPHFYHLLCFSLLHVARQRHQ